MNTQSRHIAIIMDGNYRWAKSKGLPSLSGHRAGVENILTIVRACINLNISHLTLFAFSTENWNRPQTEISFMMNLIRRMLAARVQELHDQDVQLRFIGDSSKFPRDIQAHIRRAEDLTAENSGLRLCIAANYGGRWDLTMAARQLAKAVAAGDLNPDDIDEHTLTEHLALHGQPDIDLCIRTGREQRLSNFALWDLAYTELYFTSVFWPDFGVAELQEALESFASRNRRYGKR